jgi:hypothetical protein
MINISAAIGPGIARHRREVDREREDHRITVTVGAPSRAGVRRRTLVARRNDDRRRDGAVDQDCMGPWRQRVQKRDPAVPDGKA